MALFPSLPGDSTTKEVFGMSPDRFAPWGVTCDSILRGPSPLSPGEREMIGAFVSGLNACDYCSGGHAAAAEEFGIEPGFLEKLLADIDAAPVETKMKPILAYVKKLTQTPSRLVDADAQAVYDAGWDERALHDAISVCCLFSFMNRLVFGHGVKAIPEQYAARGRAHFENGYVRKEAGSAEAAE